MRALPSVRLGKPEELEKEYSTLNIGGVTVFAHKSLEEFGELEIDLEGGVFGKRLVLRGVTQDTQGCCG